MMKILKNYSINYDHLLCDVNLLSFVLFIILNHFLLVTKMNDIQWNMFDVKATNNLHDMHLPVVTMNLNYDDNLENKSKSISFSMNPEQFAVLFAGKNFN